MIYEPESNHIRVKCFIIGKIFQCLVRLAHFSGGVLRCPACLIRFSIASAVSSTVLGVKPR
jgi:hypothetical protein